MQGCGRVHLGVMLTTLGFPNRMLSVSLVVSTRTKEFIVYTKKLVAFFTVTLLAAVVVVPTAEASPVDPEGQPAAEQQSSQSPESPGIGDEDTPEDDALQSVQSGDTQPSIDPQSGAGYPPASLEPPMSGTGSAEPMSGELEKGSDTSDQLGSVMEPFSLPESSAYYEREMNGYAATVAIPGFEDPHQIGHGWTGMTPLFGGNAARGGPADLYAIKGGSGDLLFYARHEGGSFWDPIKAGRGWQSLRQVTGGVDFTGDGVSDILGIDSSGKLRLYRGEGSGIVYLSHNIGSSGWENIRLIAAVPSGPGGKPAIYAASNDGKLFVYLTDGRGHITGTRSVGHGWGEMRFLIGSKDWNGDGTSDLFGVKDDGNLYLYRGQSSGALETRTQVGHGWNGFVSIIAGEAVDGRPALWGVRKDGRLMEYTQLKPLGSDIVAIARKYRGVPYVWGGESPKGFDCSGFVSYVYREAGIPFPGHWRKYTWDIRKLGRVIQRGEARPGDIVWKKGHVGIYLGNNQVIHAPRRNDVVREGTLWKDPVFIRYP